MQNIKLIGQVFDTYWLVEFKDNLYIIDQHAAHERVLYERTLREMKRQRIYFSVLKSSDHFKLIHAGSTASE